MNQVTRKRCFLLPFRAKKVRVLAQSNCNSLALLTQIVVRRKLCKLDGTQQCNSLNALGFSSKRHIASATDAILTNMGLRLSKNTTLCPNPDNVDRSSRLNPEKTIDRPAPLEQHI
jgi:hypothetical protein